MQDLLLSPLGIIVSLFFIGLVLYSVISLVSYACNIRKNTLQEVYRIERRMKRWVANTLFGILLADISIGLVVEGAYSPTGELYLLLVVNGMFLLPTLTGYLSVVMARRRIKQLETQPGNEH
jgi:hypothetical protein